MAKDDIEIDADALKEFCDESRELENMLKRAASSIESTANAMSAGYRTGIWHDPETGEEVGDTQPEYASDVEDKGKGAVGLVYTGNYAAMKDNFDNNTLLKALGGARV